MALDSIRATARTLEGSDAGKRFILSVKMRRFHEVSCEELSEVLR